MFIKRLLGWSGMWSFVLLTACLDQPQHPQVSLDYLKVPNGFHISHFADHVPRARTMAQGPDGTVYVGSQETGSVYAVLDHDGDGIAETQRVLLQGLDEPNGVAVVGEYLFVAEISRVSRYGPLNHPSFEKLPPTVIYKDLPHELQHGYKILKRGPDGLLYLTVGVPCNVCVPKDPRYGTLIRFRPDGTHPESLASGIRNSMGIDWHPVTRELWFTDNGRDGLGDDLPPDELNHLSHSGETFGFPRCFGKSILDPDLGFPDACSHSTPPALEMKAHVAPLGLHFYRGRQFPERFHHQLLIAQHGSWNRSVPSGYQVSLVSFDAKGHAVTETPFITGWLGSSGEVRGRPVDFLEMPDGAVLISDDKAGVIYRLTYH